VFWGLPEANAPDRVVPFGPDELAPLPPAAELYNVLIARQPPFNPQYPLFHYFVEGLFIGPFLLWTWLTGGLIEPRNVYPFGLVDPVASLRAMTIVGRIPSVLAGAGVVTASAWAGSHLWGTAAGLLAGLFVALQYSMGYYSRTANVDVPALLWISLGMCVFCAILRDRWTMRRGLRFSLFAALAVATKDASYAAFVFPSVALAWWNCRGPHPSQEQGRNKEILIATGTAAGAYVLACGVLLHPGRYLDHLRFISHGSPSAAYFSVPATLAGYSEITVKSGLHILDIMGFPMLLLAVYGLAASFRRGHGELVLIGVLPATLLFIIYPTRLTVLRFLIPSCWILGLFAARGAALLWERSRPWGAALTVITIAWAFAGQADLLWQSYFDTRYAAAEWFAAHARPGDRVVYFKSPEKLPHLPAGVVSVKSFGETSTLASRPEFVIHVPWETEEVSGRNVPPALLTALQDGSAGYRVAARWEPRSFFSRRLLSVVNPHITVFERADR